MVEDAVSRLRLPLVFWLWLFAHLPLCHRRGEGPVCSQLALLWYSLNPLFCEWAWLHVRLEPFMGKFSFFSLSLAIPQFGFLSHVSSLRLSSGHSGPVLTLSMQPEPLCPAADMSVWVSSPLGVAVRRVFCVFFPHPHPLLVMLPSEISKLPTDPPVKGFPAVWRLLLLHDSLPGMGLCP